MLFAALLLAASTSPVRTLAVLEFDNATGEAIDRVYFSDKVRETVNQLAPQLAILTRENVQQLLAANGKKLEDCGAECEVETGRLLGADVVISGRLTKVGARYKLSMRLHSTAQGTLLGSATASGKTTEEIDDATAGAVEDLLAPLGLARPQQRSTEPRARERAALIVVQTDPPQALIFLDGVERGPSPLSMEARPGNHRVEARAGGYLTATKEVAVQSGETVKASLVLEHRKGRVSVTVDRAAECAVGKESRSIAAGGLEVFDAPVGKNTVTCKADGFEPWQDEVRVEEEGAATVRASIDRPSGPPPPHWFTNKYLVPGAILVALAGTGFAVSGPAYFGTYKNEVGLVALGLGGGALLAFMPFGVSGDASYQDVSTDLLFGVGFGAAFAAFSFLANIDPANGPVGVNNAVMVGSVVAAGVGAGLVYRGILNHGKERERWDAQHHSAALRWAPSVMFAARGGAALGATASF